MPGLGNPQLRGDPTAHVHDEGATGIEAASMGWVQGAGGTSPVRIIRSLLASIAGSGMGTAERRALV